MRAILSATSQWHPVERFLLLVTAVSAAALGAVMVAHELSATPWLAVKNVPQYATADPPTTYRQLAAHLPDDVASFSYSFQYPVTVFGFYKKDCDPGYPGMLPNLEYEPASKCILTEYADEEFIGSKKSITWNLSSLADDFPFRLLSSITFVSALSLVLFARLFLPTWRWIVGTPS